MNLNYENEIESFCGSKINFAKFRLNLEFLE